MLESRTDFEKMKKLFEELGIPFKVVYNNPDVKYDNVSIVLEEDGKKIKGYRGFAAAFYFDKNYKYKEAAIFE